MFSIGRLYNLHILKTLKFGIKVRCSSIAVLNLSAECFDDTIEKIDEKRRLYSQPF